MVYNRSRHLQAFLIAMLFVLVSTLPAFGAEDGHGGAIVNVLVWLTIILVAAMLSGDLVSRFGQPAVLGELTAGIILGNLSLIGFAGLDPIKTDVAIDTLAQLGVLILLFAVGLESTVGQMMQVGLSSLLVAVAGVVTPFALGWGVGAVLLPDASVYVHAFLGATLCATSVGITARVLQDLNRAQTGEARIILGAAVLDDVLGLLVLAVVTGIVTAVDQGREIAYSDFGLTLGKAALFLVGSLFIGARLSPRMFSLASRMRARGVLLAIGLAFCFLLSWVAAQIGLAPIVGAFAAGLILENLHYKDFTDRGEHGLEELIRPIAAFLVPVFFVVTGMRTDLRALADPSILTLATALTLAAIVGKQACSLGVIGKGIDRLSVGIGMIPRGEVGLIFANIGLGLSIDGVSIINSSTFSAVVVMVIVTTVITPPALKWSFGRRKV